MKILIVEDDYDTSELLIATLKTYGCTLDLATDGQSALELARLWKYDLMLLDVQLPKIDGINVCRQLRSQENNIPILILTVQCDNKDIITGLEAGADDYLIKPCEPSHLMARIRALVRRKGNINFSQLLTWGSLCLDLTRTQVTYNQQPLILRPQEYKLLKLFLLNPHRVFSRSAILDHLWSSENFPTENAVTNLIKDLRHKLKASGIEEELIKTLYGLGYQLNSISVNQLSNQQAAPESEKSENSHHSEGLILINKFAQRFRVLLNQRISRIEETIQDLAVTQSQENFISQRQKIKEEAHRLVGSLGTYGYFKGSKIARSIEQLLNGNSTLKQKQIFQLKKLLTKLRQVTNTPLNSSMTNIEEIKKRPILLGINLNTALAAGLQQEASLCGLQLKIVQNQIAAQDYLKQNIPSVILFEFKEDLEDENGLALLRSLKEKFPHIPVLTLAQQDSLINRIKVANLGIERYIVQPVMAAQVIEAIAQLLPLSKSNQTSVMIVDDDPTLLTALKNLLTPWGLKITCLKDPSRFWQVITATNPHLLLLDIEMPTFNGIELCRVVRQDVKYGDLSILVITAHTEIEYIQQAFEAGADDLIRKPIVYPELIARVLGQIERSLLRQRLEILRRQQTQEWQHKAEIDPLTKIANRRVFDEFLQQQWQYHLQEQQHLCLILCDVDLFKAYNDYYGHLAGDHCLQQIACVLKQNIKLSTDLVARFGGEEFALILPKTNIEGGLQVAKRIKQTLAHEKIPHADSSVCQFVTVSIGITGTVPNEKQSIAHLIDTADQALYAAKKRGRNTYCLYPL